MSSTSEVTQLLADWSEGDERAAEKLIPLVYQELHRLAESYMRREDENHTLQATALVNEAYLKLVDQTRVNWQNRSHFFGVAAQIMRRILVDYARRHLAEKRGGNAETISLEDAVIFNKEKSSDIIALDEALKVLAKIDERRQKVVELRFFGGLSVDETAEVLRTSKNTVVRDWNFAKAWLYRQINKT
jgi:RNA polymerase sigma factor (TIGR02999 family)